MSSWVDIESRPPPVSTTQPGERCWCWFLGVDDRQHMGYYLGDGKVRLIHESKRRQQAFEFDQVVKWRPVSEEQFEEFDLA